MEEIIERGQFKAVIEYDEWSECDPRDQENVWRLVLNHGKYRLPNESDLNLDHYESLDELEEALRLKGAVIVVPVYGYDHSALAIRRTQFSCPWDSGILGLAYVTAEKLNEVYSGLDVQNETPLNKALDEELEELQAWVNGEVFNVTVWNSKDESDTAWGIIGYENAEQIAEELLDREEELYRIRPVDRSPATTANR